MEMGEKSCVKRTVKWVGGGAETGAFFFFVVAKSGASGISVIHQLELITSESGVSWQEAAPAAITISPARG